MTALATVMRTISAVERQRNILISNTVYNLEDVWMNAAILSLLWKTGDVFMINIGRSESRNAPPATRPSRKFCTWYINQTDFYWAASLLARVNTPRQVHHGREYTRPACKSMETVPSKPLGFCGR